MRNDWVLTLLLSMTRAAFAGVHNSAAVALHVLLMLAAAAAAAAAVFAAVSACSEAPSCNRNSDDDVMCCGQQLLYMCLLAAQLQCCWPSQYVLLMQHVSSEAGRCLLQYNSMFSCKQRVDQPS